MRKIYSLSILLSIFAVSSLFSQNTGDTIVVNVLNYQSTTRDVVANFPTNPNLTFEKVIMRYAMRCKGGLISTGAQRNLGCGEWDYSCNTYIEDPTKVDSSAATIDRYSIYPDTNSSGTYSSTPTWYGTPLIQQAVSLQNVINEDTASIGTGSIVDSSIINLNNNGGKTYLLLTAGELNSAGLIAGAINRFSFTNLGNASTLLNCKLKIKETNLNTLSYPDSTEFRNMQEVYYHNYTAAPGINRLAFHTPFIWNGTSNLLIELSYKGNSNGNNLQLACHATNNIQTIASSNDLAFNFFPSNYIEANTYKGIDSTNTRTIEAWIKTSVAGKEIVSWGTNSSGRKFTFRLDASGKLRVEVNGGSIIGTRVLNDDKWHHVAITSMVHQCITFDFC